MNKTDLQIFIKYYIPNGWKNPIKDVDFAPMISDEDYNEILSGKIPADKQYEKWYVKAAIKEWLKNNIH